MHLTHRAVKKTGVLCTPCAVNPTQWLEQWFSQFLQSGIPLIVKIFTYTDLFLQTIKKLATIFIRVEYYSGYLLI